MPKTVQVKVLSVLLKVTVIAPGLMPNFASFSSTFASMAAEAAVPARLETTPPSELETEMAEPL